MNATTKWTFAGYWNTVLGNISAAAALESYDMRSGDRQGLSTWLGEAEEAAWLAGRQGGKVPGEWADFHEKALDLIEAELGQ